MRSSELFGFAELPAGTARGLRGRARRPRRARGHAHGLGQVALLPAAGAAARRPDDRRLAARGADAGPGRGAAARAGSATGWRWSTPSRTRPTNSAALDRAAAGELRLLYVAPERFASPGLHRADAARPGSACSWSTRRTASPSGATTSGPTTSAWPTPRATLGAGVDRRLHRHGHAAGGGRHRAAGSALRDPLRVATGFDRPNISFAVARPAAHEKRPLLAEALRGEDALPAIVYAGTRAGAEELAARARPTRWARRRCAYHAGLDRERRADGPAPLPGRRRPRHRAPPTRSAWAWTSRTCARWCTPACRRRSRPTTRRPAAAGRDGDPARALLLAENRDKALHVHFIKRDEIGRRACRGWLRRPASTAARRTATARYDLDGGELARDARRRRRPARASLIGHLARAGRDRAARRRRPTAWPGRIVGAFDAPRGRALPRVGGGGRAGALAPVPRDLGLRRERRLPPARRSCATSATARTPVPRRGRLLRRLRPGPRARRRRRPSRRRSQSLDDAIVSVARIAQPAVGRTTCAEILHGARTQEDRAQLLRRPARVRHLREHAPGRHPRPHRRADRGEAARRRPAARTRCCAARPHGAA